MYLSHHIHHFQVKKKNVGSFKDISFAFKANSKSSQITRDARSFADTVFMSNFSKNKKKRMRTKNKRLQKLKYHEVDKPSEKIDKYEKNHIYFIHDNVKVVPNVSPNNQFESLNTLQICDNINGFKMFTKCKVPIFILIPREESKRYFTKNKMKIINTLEYMRKKEENVLEEKTEWVYRLMKKRSILHWDLHQTEEDMV